MTLALKHHHKQRIKRNRKHYFIVGMDKNERFTGKAIKTPSFCHCMYCKKSFEKRLINIRDKEIIRFEMSEFKHLQ